jgi:uncharacterized membrane protein YjgN (DUF898 family)
MAVTTNLAGSAGPVAAAPAETQLVYDGRNGELFVLWLKILLLGVITLGIYPRFWGRTRIRRYFWNHVSLLGDRLEYDGTGGELFRRFLVALVLFPLLLVWAPLLKLMRVGDIWIAVVTFIQFALLFFLALLAQYGSRRYQVSRTVWRGIRGGVDGSAFGYAFRALGYTLLVPITLGLALPWQYVGLWRYRTNNTGFGDVNFDFQGSGSRLMGPFLVAYACSILGAALAAGLGFGVFYAIAGLPHTKAAFEHSAGAFVAAIFTFYGIYIFISLIGYLHFFVRAFAYTAGGTSFGRVSFSFAMRKRDLFRFQLGNILLFVLTAGLGLPFIGQRYVRFFCRHLRLYNADQLTALTQAPGRRRAKGGEGLAQLFDTLDVGGFI